MLLFTLHIFWQSSPTRVGHTIKTSSLAAAAIASTGKLAPLKYSTVNVVMYIVSKWEPSSSVSLRCQSFQGKHITYSQGIFHGVLEGKPGVGGLLSSLHILDWPKAGLMHRRDWSGPKPPMHHWPRKPVYTRRGGMRGHGIK